MTATDQAPDGRHGPHVLVTDVDTPRLADDDRHHLERVLRLRAGDPLTVGDGAGAWRPCRLGTEPEPLDRVHHVPRPQPAIGVGFALIKGGRPELVVQKLTELGVDRIMPFTAARSVVRWDAAKATKNAERLRRVAREAVMQSRRAWLPTVEEIVDFATIAAGPVALAERDGGQVSLAQPVVLVGPEGGWADEERDRGLPTVRLGDGVLRAETAAIAAGTLLADARLRAAAPN
ncbi:MAG: RsmE family RNA methyltransferase [Acidimicrobiales bacterium]|nr:RsmE family RNA methyltransferase [Acidimicrobiales bacterium]